MSTYNPSITPQRVNPPGPSFDFSRTDPSSYRISPPSSSGPQGSIQPYNPGYFSPITTYPGFGTGPQMPTSGMGRPLSFNPPALSSGLPGSTPQPQRSIPSFIDARPLHGRTERINPPNLSPGLSSTWTAPSLHSNVFSSVPRVSDRTGSSPTFAYPASASPINLSIPAQQLSSVSGSYPAFRSPDFSSLPNSFPRAPLPQSSFSGPAFSQPPISPLSGRAEWVSPFQNTLRTLPSRNLGESSFLSRQPTSSDRALVRAPGSFVSPFLQRTTFLTAEDHLQIQHSYYRKFEETMKRIHQFNAPPEYPIGTWQTLNMPIFALQLDHQTTLFVNPALITEFFQRASSSQIWAVQAQLVQLSNRQLENTARIQGIYERVILHINDLPGIGGGQGAAGHVFLEFPDRKFALGNYPKGIRLDDFKNINDKTLSVECFCEKSKVEKSLDVMRQIKWTRSHNCVYTAVEGMKAMEFVHAEKIDLSKFLPLPSELRSQVLKVHGYDPVVMTYPREKIVIKHLPPLDNNEAKE